MDYLRWKGVLMSMALSAAAGAQVGVRVLDDETGQPVPYAHIAYRPLGAAQPLVIITDPKGETIIPVGLDDLRKGIAVRLSFVGYAPLADTLRDGAARTYRLSVDRNNLGEAVVTAQYSPGTVEASVHKLRVIDAQRIRRMAAQNLGDALRDQLNMRLSQDNVLGSSVSMQGLGGENVKVLIDGVPVTGRQNGNVDLSQIDLSGIERIEIVEGPLSVNYGTNALAGTINLITRKSGGAGASLKASAYAEHIGRLNTAITATKRWGRSETVLNVGRNFFNGWDPLDEGVPAFEAQPADTSRHQQWKPREQYFARLNYRWNGDRWSLGYKGEGLHDVITDRGRPRGPYYESAFDSRYLTVRLDNAVFAEGRFANGSRLNALAAHNIYVRTRNTWLRDLTTLDEELSTQPGMQDTVRFTLTNVRATWSAAPDSAKWNYELGTDVNLETGEGERIGGGAQEIGDYAVFASAEYRPIETLTLRPGARYAYNTRYGAPLIPSLNARWQFTERFTLRASYAQGFRAPSLKELYLYFVDVNHDIVGNEDLEAERSQSTSAAIVYRHARERVVYSSELSLFYNDVRDLIALAQLGATQYSYVNIGRLRTTGGSIGAGWDNGHWIVSAGASLTYRRDALAEEQDAEWLATGEVRGSLTRQWQLSGWSASLFWKYQGQQVNYLLDADGELQRGAISAFNIADANVSKQFWAKRLALTLGCKDLFDVQNLAATTSTGGVHGGERASVPMTTGRTYFLRIELELKQKG